MNIVQGIPSFLFPQQMPKSTEIPNFSTCPAEKMLREIPDPCRALKKLNFLRLVLRGIRSLTSFLTEELKNANTVPAGSSELLLNASPKRKTERTVSLKDPIFHTQKFFPEEVNFEVPFSMRTPTVAQ